MRLFLPALLTVVLAASVSAQAHPRARELGLRFPGTPGSFNAITDVPGVSVGHATLISGNGRLVRGKGPVRTGVTAVFPRGRESQDPVFAAYATLNGNGEMTGTLWLRESGFLAGPVALTNTLSVGVVRDAVIAWALRRGWPSWGFSLPVVAETWDGGLNDIDGFHVRAKDAFEALDAAEGGQVAEGNVGGGTGMVCHQFKGGIGTSSRRLPLDAGGYIVGVLVQCNYGRRARLSVLGVPVGAEIADLRPCSVLPPTNGSPNATLPAPRPRGPPPFPTGTPAPSSSSSPPTHLCFRISSSGWPGGRRWGSGGWAAWARTPPGTFFSPSRPPIRTLRRTRLG